MSHWNFNIDEAPRGSMVQQPRTIRDKETTVTAFVPDRVILATKCGKVIGSNFIPGDDKREARWEFLATGEAPVAWMLWPEHPGASS